MTIAPTSPTAELTLAQLTGVVSQLIELTTELTNKVTELEAR